MEESQAGQVHGPVVLDLGDGVGALILYTTAVLLGQEIEVSRPADQRRIHTEVLERQIQDQPVFAAVYAALPEGHYRIWGYDGKPMTEVEIVGGQVSELDWR